MANTVGYVWWIHSYFDNVIMIGNSWSIRGKTNKKLRFVFCKNQKPKSVISCRIPTREKLGKIAKEPGFFFLLGKLIPKLVISETSKYVDDSGLKFSAISQTGRYQNSIQKFMKTR